MPILSGSAQTMRMMKATSGQSTVSFSSMPAASKSFALGRTVKPPSSSSSSKRKGKGRGRHGDSAGHARAARARWGSKRKKR